MSTLRNAAREERSEVGPPKAGGVDTFQVNKVVVQFEPVKYSSARLQLSISAQINNSHLY